MFTHRAIDFNRAPDTVYQLLSYIHEQTLRSQTTQTTKGRLRHREIDWPTVVNADRENGDQMNDFILRLSRSE